MRNIIVCVGLIALLTITVAATVPKKKRSLEDMNLMERRIVRASHIANSKTAPKELMHAAEMIEAGLTAKLSKKEAQLATDQAEEYVGRNRHRIFRR